MFNSFQQEHIHLKLVLLEIKKEQVRIIIIVVVIITTTTVTSMTTTFPTLSGSSARHLGRFRGCTSWPLHSSQKSFAV